MGDVIGCGNMSEAFTWNNNASLGLLNGSSVFTTSTLSVAVVITFRHLFNIREFLRL